MSDLLSALRNATNRGLTVTFQKTEVMQGILVAVQKSRGFHIARRKTFVISDDLLNDELGEGMLCLEIDRMVDKIA